MGRKKPVDKKWVGILHILQTVLHIAILTHFQSLAEEAYKMALFI